MLVRDILTSKGTTVVTVAPTETVHTALERLVEHNIGAVLVVEGGRVVGILSERDILRLTNEDPGRVDTALVADVMTRELVVSVPDDAVPYAKAIMTNNRVRHLPVLEDGKLVGVVSIGDLVRATLTDLQAENRWLRDYVQGGG